SRPRPAQRQAWPGDADAGASVPLFRGKAAPDVPGPVADRGLAADDQRKLLADAVARAHGVTQASPTPISVMARLVRGHPCVVSRPAFGVLRHAPLALLSMTIQDS